MLHTFGNEYISRDDNRRLSTELDERLKENVALTTAALNDARKIITDRNQVHLKQHKDMMAQSHQAIEAASLAYRAEMAKQKGILEEHTETCRSMIAGMGVAFSDVRQRILSVDVTCRIQLDREELRLYAELKRSRDAPYSWYMSQHIQMVFKMVTRYGFRHSPYCGHFLTIYLTPWSWGLDMSFLS